MTTEAKLDQWIIDGIEFEARRIVDPGYVGRLPAGLVRDPNDSDLFFFSPASFAATELQQLVDDGYLAFCYPQSIALVKGGECFCVRLALDNQHKFYNRVDKPEPADCELCKRTFPFVNDGSNMFESAPATGPSYACGGDPAEWDVACTECLERGDDDLYDYDPCDEEDW
jgi:hypothetical protein